MIILNPLLLTKKTTLYLIHLLGQCKQPFISSGTYEINVVEHKQLTSLSVELTHALLLRKEQEDDSGYNRVEILAESLTAGSTATITLSCASLNIEKAYTLETYNPSHQYIVKTIAHNNKQQHKKRIIKEAQRANLGGDNLDCKPVTFDEHYGYITMRKVPGIELHLYISQAQCKKTTCSLSNLLTIMRNVIVAVQKVHDKGLVHRDIKPENIIINPKTLKVTLIDFGYARDSKKTQLCMRRKGTLFFHAPELLTEGMITTAGDCFSLGRTLGELLGDYSSSQIKLSGQTQKEHIETVLKFYKHGSLIIYPVVSMPVKLNKSLLNIVKGLSEFDELSRLNTQQALRKLDKLIDIYVPSEQLQVKTNELKTQGLRRTISL